MLGEPVGGHPDRLGGAEKDRRLQLEARFKKAVTQRIKDQGPNHGVVISNRYEDFHVLVGREFWPRESLFKTFGYAGKRRGVPDVQLYPYSKAYLPDSTLEKLVEHLPEEKDVLNRIVLVLENGHVNQPATESFLFRSDFSLSGLVWNSVPQVDSGQKPA